MLIILNMLIVCFAFSNYAEVSEMSSRLTSESRIYADKARDLNQQVSYCSFFICCYTYTMFSYFIFY
jgi:hypothetical protein